MTSEISLDLRKITDRDLRAVGEKVASHTRLSNADAELLFTSPDLLGVGMLADFANRRMHGDVVTFAATPAGTLFGLAGLYDLGSPRFPVLRDSVRGAAIDSLYVYGEPSQERWIQVRAMLDRRFLDSAVSFLKRPTPSFEC